MNKTHTVLTEFDPESRYLKVFICGSTLGFDIPAEVDMNNSLQHDAATLCCLLPLTAKLAHMTPCLVDEYALRELAHLAECTGLERIQDNNLQALPVFYRPEMVAESGSFSPSAGKPRLAVESWQALGFPLDIRSFDPVTRAQIKRAHNPVFVDDLLDCRIENGFGNHRADVAASLPYTSGSMLAAAQEALRNGVGAISPTSGFHHAGYAHAAGFCSLNGLMVTAMNLPELRVGILDFDMHYGDGTNDIIIQLDQHHRVIDFTQGGQRRVSGGAFLYSIPDILKRFEGCDVLLYQGGADPAIGDPLGNWLTVEQLAKRDALVFSGLRRMGVPVAWNLAGGYQSPFENVLRIHDNTMRAAARIWLSYP